MKWVFIIQFALYSAALVYAVGQYRQELRARAEEPIVPSLVTLCTRLGGHLTAHIGGIRCELLLEPRT